MDVFVTTIKYYKSVSFEVLNTVVLRLKLTKAILHSCICKSLCECFHVWFMLYLCRDRQLCKEEYVSHVVWLAMNLPVLSPQHFLIPKKSKVFSI